MFGHSLFGIAFFGAAYFGPSAGTPPAPSTLRDWGAARGFLMGAMATAPELAGGGTYAATLAAEYNLVTPGNCMKFGLTEASQNVFTYTDGDALVSFAQAHGMVIHGHNLVWVLGLPAWVTGGGFNATTLAAVMQNHITNLLGHWSGKIQTWDVVNEPLTSAGALQGAAGTWYAVIGASYIDKAFTYARAADPSAKLWINEFGCEWPGPKQDALYTLVTGMLAAGTPIDGVGFQMHYGLNAPGSNVIQASLKRFADLGLQVGITEAEVRIADVAASTALTAQAAVYAAYLDAALLAGAQSFATWGFTDASSSIPAINPGFGRGLPFDASYAKKAAYDALYARLQSFAGAGVDPTLWFTGLENEDASFSSEVGTKAVTSANTVTLQTAVKHAGANAALVTFDGTGVVGYVTRKVYTRPGELWVRAYVQVNTAFAFGGDTQQCHLINLEAVGALRVYLAIACGGAGAHGSLRWFVQSTDGAVNTTIYLGTLGEIVHDQWYEVALHWKAGTGANGGAEFFVNGVSFGSVLNKNYSALTVDEVRMGADFGGSAPSVGSLLYLDDLAIDVIDPGAASGSGSGTSNWSGIGRGSRRRRHRTLIDPP